MKGAVFSVLVSFVALIQVIDLTEATGPTPKTTTPLKCLNEGIFDGVKCICSGNTEGFICERILDRVEIGKTAETTISVELTIVNQVYTQDLSDFTSDEYKKFETRFNEKMISVLSGISKGVKIQALRKSKEDGTLVIHDVLIDILYNQSLPVIEQYEDNFRKISTLLKEDTCKLDSLCIDGNTVSMTRNRPLSEKDLCVRSLNSKFIEFFDPDISIDGLACVSHCDLSSPKYLNCTVGRCQIMETGSQCFCPKTDLYLYAYSGCRGAILKTALYGGVGAAIAVLIIAIVIIGVFLIRKKNYK